MGKRPFSPLSQDQLHSFTPGFSPCYYHWLHSVPSAKKPEERCGAGRGLWSGCSGFSLLFLPSCSFALLCHGPSVGCSPFQSFRRQEGCNASAVAELIYLSCSSDIVQMPSSDLTQLLLNGLRGPDQRQPPCTAAESYPCECACLHMERGLLLKGPSASSLPGEELRSHR